MVGWGDIYDGRSPIKVAFREDSTSQCGEEWGRGGCYETVLQCVFLFGRVLCRVGESAGGTSRSTKSSVVIGWIVHWLDRPFHLGKMFWRVLYRVSRFDKLDQASFNAVMSVDMLPLYTTVYIFSSMSDCSGSDEWGCASGVL